MKLCIYIKIAYSNRRKIADRAAICYVRMQNSANAKML